MTVPPTARPVDLQRHLEPAPYTVQVCVSLSPSLFVSLCLFLSLSLYLSLSLWVWGPALQSVREHTQQYLACGIPARSLTSLPWSEKDAELAQKLGQLQPFIAALPQDCMGQLACFGPT